MKICGIICELNPFHNGHEYLFREARRETGADRLIAVMSGDFVQRGIPAICDKYSRTRMALEGGADLVIELPTIYSTASADYFALAGVSVLTQLKCVDFLCFGSECGDIELLKAYAGAEEHKEYEPHILSQGSSKETMKSKISSLLKEGNSYVKAYSIVTGNEHASNDMLAIRYLKSINLLEESIIPVVIKRHGSRYLDDGIEADSATAIRRRIMNAQSFSENVPSYVKRSLENIKGKSFPIVNDDFSQILYSVIDRIIEEEKLGTDRLEEYMDVSSNIAGRIRNNLGAFSSYDDFVGTIHSKEYTKSRVMRALLHIMLGIRKEDYPLDFEDCIVPYARILGFRKDSTDVLSIMKEKSLIPIISKAADGKTILEEDMMRIFDLDVHSANIYEQVCSFKFRKINVNEYSKELVII